MTWATKAIEALKEGKSVRIRPSGRSMLPLVKPNELVTVVPAAGRELVVSDIVLCHVSGRDYLHKIVEIRDGRYLIGNNRGHTNGWILRDGIYGVLYKPLPLAGFTAD